MMELSTGNFDVTMEYKGKDEIGILSAYFNNMVKKLKDLINENYQSKIRENELLFLEKEAQLNALQQQINPHFLYNTLESIKWMAYMNGAKEASDMATALGKFFKGSITKGNDWVTLEEEIEHLKNYIYIQQLRYQDKFIISWDIDEEIKYYKTIKLILQPILENAIVHGIEDMKTGGIITIKGYMAEKSVCFEITDNGRGMSIRELTELKSRFLSDLSGSKQGSIGISNVFKRLKLYFGENSSFVIESEEGKGTTVKFRIPAINETDSA
jgi:two-component system, sensor histidine kinase YesM